MVALLGACGGGVPTVTPTVKSACPDASLKGSIVVLSASSMVNVFTDVQRGFLETHPCVTEVTYSYGSSAALATQIVNGSPADVFVSASEATMKVVEDAGAASSPQVFARNYAAIMVSNSSKFVETIRGLNDLADKVNPGITVGVCVASAPCGSTADAVLGKGGLSRNAIVDTETQSAEDLVTKLKLGELDAGIVFHSDCQQTTRDDQLVCVAIPMEANTTTKYLVAALNNRTVARQFVDYINGSDFKAALQDKFGFLAP